MKGKVIGALITVFLCAVLFAVGFDKKNEGTADELYLVFLNGEKIGCIESKEALYDLIDKEQVELKKKYNVEKVYPPEGLKITKTYSYNEKLDDVKEIYEEIKNNGDFTVPGYVATIIYTEKKIKNDGEILEPGKPVKLYMMDKKYFTEALYNTAAAFIGTENLTNYDNNTQVEITEKGEIINSIYFEETMTIKKDLISTKNYIFQNSDDLSKYLLFSSLEDQKNYVTKEGENLEAIADANNLNIEELLIANPQYPSQNILLTAGENINVGLIAPLVSVVYKKTIVDDIDVSYKTEYVNDPKKYADYNQTTTEGKNGVTRITQDVKYINGEIQSLNISKRETIKEPINKVVTRGTKRFAGENVVYHNSQGNDDWSWPTISPFIITSKYKWRWGRMHQGIDISGCGYGSPIYAVRSGYVYKVNYNASKAEGLSIYIDHGNGYVTQYMHVAKILVKEGQNVNKEQKIALMGSTGSSTGTHLHLGVWVGKPYEGGTAKDPCRSIFSC